LLLFQPQEENENKTDKAYKKGMNLLVIKGQKSIRYLYQFLAAVWLNPWRKDGMEWKQWLKCVVLYRSFIVYKGGEGEGRGCEMVRI